MFSAARNAASGEEIVNAIEDLSQTTIHALEDPGAYPHDPSAIHGVETIQTHISHVYLTRDLVYKLRKSVVLPFLSFGTRSQRNADCIREVSLNRRLAPGVYLGIAPVQENTATGACRVGLPGTTL